MVLVENTVLTDLLMVAPWDNLRRSLRSRGGFFVALALGLPGNAETAVRLTGREALLMTDPSWLSPRDAQDSSTTLGSGPPPSTPKRSGFSLRQINMLGLPLFILIVASPFVGMAMAAEPIALAAKVQGPKRKRLALHRAAGLAVTPFLPGGPSRLLGLGVVCLVPALI